MHIVNLWFDFFNTKIMPIGFIDLYGGPKPMISSVEIQPCCMNLISIHGKR